MSGGIEKRKRNNKRETVGHNLSELSDLIQQRNEQAPNDSSEQSEPEAVVTDEVTEPVKPFGTKVRVKKEKLPSPEAFAKKITADIERQNRRESLEYTGAEAARFKAESKKEIPKDKFEHASDIVEGREELRAYKDSLADEAATDRDYDSAVEANKKIDLNKLVEARRAERRATAETVKMVKDPVPPKSAKKVMDIRNNKYREQREDQHVDTPGHLANLENAAEFKKALKRFEKGNTAKSTEEIKKEKKEEAAPEVITPETPKENKETKETKKDRKGEAFPYLRTKLLDKKLLQYNEWLVGGAEKREEESRAKLKGFDLQLAEIQSLREAQRKGLEAAKARLGDSWVGGKVERKAQEELADMARREENIKADRVRETARLDDAIFQKKRFQEKAEEIRTRVAERMHTFVSPLEAQIEGIKAQEAKAQSRIDRFKKERMHLSERLLDAKNKMEQAPLESVSMPWKTWIKKATKLFDNIDSKLNIAEARKAEFVEKRLELEAQINKWKELGESFEKKAPETPKLKTDEAVAETPASGEVRSSSESVKSSPAEIPDVLRDYIERWNRQNGTKFRLTDDIAKWIQKPADRAMNYGDIERGVTEHFTVRRRGIWNWPVLSWFSRLVFKRRLNKMTQH